MILAYRYLVAPLALLLLPLAAIFNKKIAEGLRLRRQPHVYPEFAQAPIWIHAASGEFEYAKSVIREFKRRAPHIPIVVTYFSPTYARNVQSFPGVDYALPLPLDLPGPVSSFLKRVNPRLCLLARTDFWPELLTQTRARGIPVHVFSFTQKTGGGRISRWRLSLVDRIHCVSLEDRENLLRLKVQTPCDVLGDTRYDQVEFRLSHPKDLPASLKPQDEIPVLVAGSTWPEDEQVLLPAVAELIKQGRLRLILAPHEPTTSHVDELKAQMTRHGMDCALFSSAEEWRPSQVLLVDQVGWLAELYAWGDMAFIGGSFRKTVHSVMEALGAGLKTFVGPMHVNNREAIEFQKILDAVVVVQNKEEFQAKIAALSATQLQSFRAQFPEAFQAKLGATQRLVDALTPIVDR